MDLCPIHYVATQRRGASRRKRGGGGGRGGVPSPTRAGIDPGACICRYLRRVYRATSRCLLATYYRTPPSLRGDTLMTGGPPTRISLAQGHSVTKRERELPVVMDAFGFSIRIMRVWGAKRVLSFEGYCYGFFPFFLFNGVDASKFKLIIRDLVRMTRGECILIWLEW